MLIKQLFLKMSVSKFHFLNPVVPVVYIPPMETYNNALFYFTIIKMLFLVYFLKFSVKDRSLFRGGLLVGSCINVSRLFTSEYSPELRQVPGLIESPLGRTGADRGRVNAFLCGEKEGKGGGGGGWQRGKGIRSANNVLQKGEVQEDLNMASLNLRQPSPST